MQILSKLQMYAFSKKKKLMKTSKIVVTKRLYVNIVVFWSETRIFVAGY
jgi:hypothetical protein